MKQWIYLLTPARLEMVTGQATEQEMNAVSRHFAYLQDLTEKGIMILVGRTRNNDEHTLGIAIFEAPNESAARIIMDNDPAVQSGAMKAKLYPYSIALMRK